MSKETPEGWEDTYRPPVERRWLGGRIEPGTILLRSQWLYSHDEDVLIPESRKASGLHPFGRGAKVVASEWPQRYSQFDDVQGHVHAAVESFGDDADIVIEVRLARPEELV